jgi:2-C-methyl-D-erythritol 4-phosphate cytidylyltransferase
MTEASWLFWYGDDLKINEGNVMKTKVTRKKM